MLNPPAVGIVLVLIRRSPGQSTAPILKEINLMIGVRIKDTIIVINKRITNLNAKSIVYSRFPLFLFIGKCILDFRRNPLNRICSFFDLLS